MREKKEAKTKKQAGSGKCRKTSTAGQAKPAKTIKQVVIESITANNLISNEAMIAAVKAQFPKSAFDSRHAAWYRSQARKGLLTGTPIIIPSLTTRLTLQSE